MSGEKNTDSAIIALTDGIGAEFGRAARRSFYAQHERLLGNASFRKQEKNEQQALIDLLALAAVFQSVIVPIQCTGNFVQILRQAEAGELRVGRDKLTPAWAKNAQRVAEGFSIILTRLSIPVRLLQYPTLEVFVKNAVTYFENRDA